MSSRARSSATATNCATVARRTPPPLAPPAALPPGQPRCPPPERPDPPTRGGGREGRTRAGASPPARGVRSRLESYPWAMPSLLDRALNVGEAKKFKAYQKRVALIRAFEGELEHDSDAEMRERMDALRERAADGDRSAGQLDTLLPECFAIVR